VLLNSARNEGGTVTIVAHLHIPVGWVALSYWIQGRLYYTVRYLPLSRWGHWLHGASCSDPYVRFFNALLTPVQTRWYTPLSHWKHASSCGRC